MKTKKHNRKMYATKDEAVKSLKGLKQKLSILKQRRNKISEKDKVTTNATSLASVNTAAELKTEQEQLVNFTSEV